MAVDHPADYAGMMLSDISNRGAKIAAFYDRNAPLAPVRPKQFIANDLPWNTPGEGTRGGGESALQMPPGRWQAVLLLSHSTIAIRSISTLAPFGSWETATVLRAGL